MRPQKIVFYVIELLKDHKITLFCFLDSPLHNIEYISVKYCWVFYLNISSLELDFYTVTQ